MEAVTIDIVADVVCPWCYIGKRRLEQALALLPVEPVIRWRPFQLDPTIPQTGLDRAAYLERKFGSAARVAALHQQLFEVGEGEGIRFSFARINRSPNTLDAHRLIRWSHSLDCQNAVVERLFEHYFVEGGDVGDRAVLLQIAQDSGMAAEVVARLFAEGADIGAVQHEIATARRLGIVGVPTFIFAGRHALSGAQSKTVIAAAIRRAQESGSIDSA
jgi:predicted DsbA family dithiol-disulfide isomerase